MILLSADTWEVRTTTKKGRGVFATRDIEPGAVIGDYIGKTIRIDDEDKYEKGNDLYLMYYSETASIYPDKKKPGIHFLNHSCTPNCWMYTYHGHTLFFALRRIHKGEELTISYLMQPLDEDCDPCTHLCYCDGLICDQTMHLTPKRHSAWTLLDERLAKKTKHKRAVIGKILPLLDRYPKRIGDHPVYTLFGAIDQVPLRVTASKLPSITTMRKLLRVSGRTLLFPKLRLHIYGVRDGLLVSKIVGRKLSV